MELAGMGALLSAGIGLVVVGAVLSYGAELTGDIKDDQTSGSIEYNITQDAQDGIAKIGGKLSLIAGIVVIVVVVTMLVRNFRFAG